jgi:hypothetical protein
MLIIAPGGATGNRILLRCFRFVFYFGRGSFQVFLITVGHAPDSLLLDLRNSEREAVDCDVIASQLCAGPFAISQDC